PWLDVYADQDTRRKILLDALDVPTIASARRFAIQGLWKVDTTKAVEVSRQIVTKRPSDIQALRQHANLCAGFFLFDEADQHFLRALRLAGAKNEKSLFPILFEYFEFLVRFNDFEKARILASILETQY